MRRALLALVLFAAACAPRARSTSEPKADRARSTQSVASDYPGELVSPERIAGDFLARQRVQVTWAGGEIAFDAVLQKKGNTLTLLGLTPFGARAFTLVQTGRDVSFEAEGAPPFPPRNILLDVHRALFLGLPDAPLAEGEHQAEVSGEEIEEFWSRGRLFERRFRRLDGRPSGTITVTYEGGMAPGVQPPHSLTLENGWFGYRLLVETRSFQAL